MSMRSVAKVLGVEAMSRCEHVPSEDALLDDLADWVFRMIQLPDVGDTWREALTAGHDPRGRCSRYSGQGHA